MTGIMDRYMMKGVIFTPILGSQPTKDVASNFLASKLPEGKIPDDEYEMLPDALERGTTVFHRDESGMAYLWAYQLKGFLKYVGQTMNKSKLIGGIAGLRSKVVSNVFFIGENDGSPNNQERRIALHVNGHKEDHLERSLRAETAQGSRIALARSEMVGDDHLLDIGQCMYFYCEIHILKGSVITEEVLRTMLDYGRYQGLGQWRGGDFGKFVYELQKIDE